MVTELLSVTDVTTVGVLIVGIVALYLGLVTPRHTVQEMRARLAAGEAEREALHAEVIRHIEEKAELRGEVGAMRREVEALRSQIEGLRSELGCYRARGET
jgi:predicted  nucleic acid-binding Zn-ribbon protein